MAALGEVFILVVLPEAEPQIIGCLHVRARVAVELVETATVGRAVGARVHALRVVVAAELVVADRQVEGRLGVPRVQGERALECGARLVGLAALVQDHAHHVVHVGVVVVRLQHDLEVLLRLVVLAGEVVLATDDEMMFGLRIHGGLLLRNSTARGR